MADEWHYTNDGNQQGPVSASELKEFAASGSLSPSDLVWKEGMSDWKPASSVKGLFPGNAATPKSSTPSIPTSNSTAIGSPIQKAIQWFTFGSSLPQPLPFETPWEPEERTTPNKSDVGRAIAAIPIGIIFALSLLLGLAFPPIWLFSLWMGALLASVVFWKGFGRSQIAGRWVLRSNEQEWVEFIQGGNFRRSDGTTGKWDYLKNGKFIDFIEKRQITESWRLIHFQGGIGASLEVEDQHGNVLDFKKGKTQQGQDIAKAFSKLLDTSPSRSALLIAVWRYAENKEHWCQFTDDGAIVTSQGPAGRFSLSGEQPNEVITMDLADGSSNSWNVVSLTKTQLVVAEGGQTMILRKSGAVKSASESSQSSGVPDETNQTEGGASEGFLSKVWSFMTKHKCPKCNQRAGVETNRELINQSQDVRSVPIKGADGQYRKVQKVFSHDVYRYHCQCKSCNHQWTFEKTYSGEA